MLVFHTHPVDMPTRPVSALITRHAALLSICCLSAGLPMTGLPPVEAATPKTPAVVAIDAGVIRRSTTWRRGTIHRLTGLVRIADGATLTIEAGTRIEGDAASTIVVERTGRIEAVGTLTEPIVLGCTDGAVASRDCWGGIVVAGNAPVNGGTPDSPPARGTGAAGCAQRADDAAVSAYGGCAADDNSGTLRYVRVENAVRGVQLLGVGSGTQVEFVQVFGAGGGGVTLRGGTVDLRHVLVTSSGPVGLRWTGGWVGRAQHLLVQMPAEGGVGIDGVNDAAMPAATPRSAPELFNVTVVRLADPPGSPLTTGIRIADGSGVRVSNLFVAGFDVVLDIDGAASCALIGTALQVSHAIVGSTGAFGDPDADTGCTTGAGTEDIVLTDATIARETDAAAIAAFLKAGFVAVLPDFRATSQLFVSGAIAPPVNGFYLPSAYVGAVELESVGVAIIPWHSGWTRDDLISPVVALGGVAGVVQSPTRGALNGVRVEAGGLSALTSATGVYQIDGIVSGVSSVRLTTAPTGCTLPTPVSVTIAGATTSTADIAVACSTIMIKPNVLLLTYLCGRTFQVRNSNEAVVEVTWDVFETTDAGTLTLPARPLSASFSETVFETTATGTVRLFYQGTQVGVKANGGAVCAS
jgi:hypothetical protein